MLALLEDLDHVGVLGNAGLRQALAPEALGVAAALAGLGALEGHGPAVGVEGFEHQPHAALAERLHDSIGADLGLGGVDGFAYSDALKGIGGEWTFEKLDHFLTKPASFAPGTKMSFAGLKKEKDIVAITEYLKSLSQ